MLGDFWPGSLQAEYLLLILLGWVGKYNQVPNRGVPAWIVSVWAPAPRPHHIEPPLLHARPHGAAQVVRHPGYPAANTFIWSADRVVAISMKALDSVS
jgi:hypothetical protein